jgi:hypothetical protein
MKTYAHLRQYLPDFFLEWEMFQTKDVQKKHILCSTSFFSENRAVYEIVWKIMIQPDSPPTTI